MDTSGSKRSPSSRSHFDFRTDGPSILRSESRTPGVGPLMRQFLRLPVAVLLRAPFLDGVSETFAHRSGPSLIRIVGMIGSIPVQPAGVAKVPQQPGHGPEYRASTDVVRVSLHTDLPRRSPAR